MAFVGLLVRTPEVVNNASFIVIFPLTFIANTFVPTRRPARAAEDVRRSGTRCRRSPQAARELFGNPSPLQGLGARSRTVLADAAPAGLLADLDRRPSWRVCIPLSVRQYKKAAEPS